MPFLWLEVWGIRNSSRLVSVISCPITYWFPFKFHNSKALKTASCNPYSNTFWSNCTLHQSSTLHFTFHLWQLIDFKLKWPPFFMKVIFKGKPNTAFSLTLVWNLVNFVLHVKLKIFWYSSPFGIKVLHLRLQYSQLLNHLSILLPTKILQGGCQCECPYIEIQKLFSLLHGDIPHHYKSN